MTAAKSAVVLSNAHRLGDQRIARWVAGLRERGYAVRVVALDEPTVVDATELWDDDTVAITRLGPASRLMRMTRAVPLVLRHGADVVVAIDPELFAPVAVAQRLRGGQSVIDVHEDFEALATSGRGRRAARAVAHTAAWGNIVVVADDHVPPRHTPVRLVGRNQPLPDDDATLAPLWRPDSNPHKTAALPVVYVGGLTVERGAAAMTEALAHSEGWTLDLFGPATPEVADAITTAVQRYPGRLRWWGPIPNRTLRTKLGDYAIGLCPLASTEAFRRALPAKITEYHHAGLGIVATDLPRVAAGTSNPQSAILIPAGPDLARSLATVLSQLADDPDSVQALQLAARQHRQTLDQSESLSDAIARMPL